MEIKGLVNLKTNLGLKAEERPNESQRKLSKTYKMTKLEKIYKGYRKYIWTQKKLKERPNN